MQSSVAQLWIACSQLAFFAVFFFFFERTLSLRYDDQQSAYLMLTVFLSCLLLL